jgi:hypothetical protein
MIAANTPPLLGSNVYREFWADTHYLRRNALTIKERRYQFFAKRTQKVSLFNPGAPGGGPMRAGIPVADLSASLFCAMGIMTALLEVSGEGQWVQASLLQAQVFMLDFQAARTAWTCAPQRFSVTDCSIKCCGVRFPATKGRKFRD